MVSNWHKAVFAWSFGMVWGFTQAIVQCIYNNFYCNNLQLAKEYADAALENAFYDQPELTLTKEEEESLDEQWPTTEEASDEEYVSAARYYEEADKCDKLYWKAQEEYLNVIKNTTPDDPVREKYKPKPFPSKKEIKQSYYKHNGMFTN